jgi:hypothetical protein
MRKARRWPSSFKRSLFDLSPSAARAAHGLAAGNTFDDIAGQAAALLSGLYTFPEAAMPRGGLS